MIMEKRNSYKTLAVCVLVASSLAACSNVQKDLGLAREAPDEFKVVSNAPLSVPPEFNLRPPVPGASRPQVEDVNTIAREVLTSDKSKQYQSADVSKGESAILSKLGTEQANSSIRQELDEEAREEQQQLNEKNKAQKFLAYLRGEDAKEQDPEVNASKEKRRINENVEAGKPVNEGEVAENGKSKKGLLNRIFNF